MWSYCLKTPSFGLNFRRTDVYLKLILQMRKITTTLLLVVASIFATAQTVSYAYDNAGNRTERIINLSSGSPLTRRVDTTSIPRVAEEVPPKFYQDKLDKSRIRLYPNPTKGALAVEFLQVEKDVKYQISVYNLQGRLVFQQNNAEAYTNVDLTSNPSGMYILRISSPTSHVEWKIVKE